MELKMVSRLGLRRPTFVQFNTFVYFVRSFVCGIFYYTAHVLQPNSIFTAVLCSNFEQVQGPVKVVLLAPFTRFLGLQGQKPPTD